MARKGKPVRKKGTTTSADTTSLHSERNKALGGAGEVNRIGSSGGDRDGSENLNLVKRQLDTKKREAQNTNLAAKRRCGGWGGGGRDDW